LLDDRARRLIDLSDGILCQITPEAVIDRMLQAGRSLTGARYAALGVVDSVASELTRFITSGIEPSARAEIGELPRGRGVLGELMRDPTPLRLDKVGDHPRSYGFPTGHPPMSTFLGVPMFVNELVYGSLYLAEKDGGPFTETDEETVVAVVRAGGLALAHANAYTSAAAQRDELTRSVAALEATTEIARAIGDETDVDVILELVAKRGRALVEARSLLIEIVDGAELVVAALAGDAPAELVGRRIGLADTVASTALRTGTTQRLEGGVNHARFDQHGLGRLGVKATAGLVVPLVFHGYHYGVIVVIDHLREDQTFAAEDQRLLEAFAASAATALATARANKSELQRQRITAAEDERGRWARELHDETLQSLGGLQILLSGAHRRGGLLTLEQAMAEGTKHLHHAISNLRSLVTDLRPPALDELGLEAALDALTERVRASGLDVDTSIDLAYEKGRATTRPPPELETALYRISQEALTNATKHGDATRAVVEIQEDDRTVRLSVRDDGRGFDVAAQTHGFGLLGMRERVGLLSGTLDITSVPGNGTTVVAHFPVKRGQAPGVREPSRAHVTVELSVAARSSESTQTEWRPKVGVPRLAGVMS
jgi:signal transduction histidine kinase